jgi:hypothetical protein
LAPNGGQVVLGLILAWQKGYLVQALTFQKPVCMIGIGMWLALIMAFWPNQQKVLGLVEASADAKAAAGRFAGMTWRINTRLSIPMLYCMGGAAERRSLIAAGLPVPPSAPASRRPSFRLSGRWFRPRLGYRATRPMSDLARTVSH